MDSQQQPLEALQDIKRIMERSSRFISLSGWSGVAAGLCALGGAWAANRQIDHYLRSESAEQPDAVSGRVIRGLYDAGDVNALTFDLIITALVTFVAAALLAFLFTYRKSRKDGVPIWGRTVQRLAWNTILPMAVGGLFILRAMDWGYFELIAPGCLLFYGLALVNASKYTQGELRYLGYGQLLLGVLSLWITHYGLVFWAIGFGIFHIIYGIAMWMKYERN